MTAPAPVKGGMVGFADGHVAFCTACGWRGIATYPGQPKHRRARRARRHGHEHASTYCPGCQREPDTQPRATPSRRRDMSKARRKQSRAARRRNR